MIDTPIHSTADVIAQQLRKLGVVHVFGMPGGASLPLLEAFLKEGIDFVLVRHEGSAGFMADAVYQLNGTIGVSLSTLGPGATNLVSGIAQSFTERSRVLAIIGQISPDLATIYTHQILNQRALFQPICKDFFPLYPHRSEEQLRKVLRSLLFSKAGPVVMEVSKEVCLSPCLSFDLPVTPLRGVADLNEAALMLHKSSRPILFIGAEDLSEEAADALSALAEKANIPVLSTYRAKGMIDENHPCSIGACGLSPVVDTLQQEFLRRCDLIITVGLDPVELRPNWLPGWPPATPVLNLSQEGQSDILCSFALDLRGDIALMLGGLVTEHCSRWSLDELRCHRSNIEALFEDGEKGPATMIRCIQQSLPQDSILSVDVGAHRITASHVWKCRRPRSMLQSNGFSSMGVGLPMGIAVALLRPDSTAVVICGDMGLWMALGEFGIIQERQLDIIVIYLADRCLSLIEVKQERDNLSKFGLNFDNPDPISLAKAFGGQGHISKTVAELQSALALAKNGGFHLIEAHIDSAAYRRQM